MAKSKNPVGRPRTTAPSVKDCEALGKEYIQWLGDNLGAVHHTEFYSIHKHILTSDWDSIRDCPEFRPYYEQARFILAKRHMTGFVKEGIAHRFLRLYLGDLKQSENEDKAYDAQLKIQEQEAEAMNLFKLKQKIEAGEITQQ